MTTRTEKSLPSRFHIACTILYLLSMAIHSYAYSLEDIAHEKVSRFAPDLTEGERQGGKELTKKGNGGMWFGPRLGKRAYSYSQGQGSPALRRLLLEALQDPRAFEDLPDFLGNSYEKTGAKRRFTPRLGRDSGEIEARHVEFVPRLGRELALSLPSSSLSSDNDVASIPLLYGRYAAEERLPFMAESGVPPFAPRLGRELADFYNALGLSSLKDVSNLPRVARSVQSTKTKETMFNNEDKSNNKS